MANRTRRTPLPEVRRRSLRWLPRAVHMWTSVSSTLVVRQLLCTNLRRRKPSAPEIVGGRMRRFGGFGFTLGFLAAGACEPSEQEPISPGRITLRANPGKVCLPDSSSAISQFRSSDHERGLSGDQGQGGERRRPAGSRSDRAAPGRRARCRNARPGQDHSPLFGGSAVKPASVQLSETRSTHPL